MRLGGSAVDSTITCRSAVGWFSEKISHDNFDILFEWEDSEAEIIVVNGDKIEANLDECDYTMTFKYSEKLDTYINHKFDFHSSQHIYTVIKL